MKIIFCDRCNESVPDRLPLVKKRNGKNICYRCISRFTRSWRVFVLTLFVAAVVGGLWLRKVQKQDTHDTRVSTVRMIKVAHLRMNAIIQWIDETRAKLYDGIKANDITLKAYQVELRKLQVAMEAAERKIIERLLGGDKKLLESDKALLARLAALEARATKLKTEIAQVGYVPYEKVENALKSIVRITVVDKRGKPFHFGSGVLVARKDGYYYGFTAYHVLHGVMKYLQQIEPKQEEKDRLHPKMLAEVFNRIDDPNPSGAYQIEVVTNGKVIPIKSLGGLKSSQDFLIFRFKSTDKLCISEMASEMETKTLRPHDPVLGMGIHPVMRPAVYAGKLSALDSVQGGNMAFQTMAWPGMSGSPIFDARTMKVIAICQKMSLGRVGGNSVVVFGHPLHRIRAELRKF